MATYPKGIRVFNPKAGAKPFVKGSIVITPNELLDFCQANKDLLSEYKDQPQLKLDLLEGDNGLYLTVNTYKPNNG
jgi:hypothetical protein